MLNYPLKNAKSLKLSSEQEMHLPHTNKSTHLLLSDRSQAKPKTGKEIASALLCAPPTVANIRRKYSEGGIAKALYDRPRPGQAPKITGEIEAQLITWLAAAP